MAPEGTKGRRISTDTYPTFSNVLLHVNGAEIESIDNAPSEAASLVFDENKSDLDFSVIDGQHRINGAYLAVQLLQLRGNSSAKWEIPAEIFIDLDKPRTAPVHQAQIFIDVNFYQKKVDRSLVADLFPTARGSRGPIDNKERAQDIGRKLMLEIGPLVGLVQIPGIKYGTLDVVTLATLNSAVEDNLEYLYRSELTNLDAQAEFIAQCLDAWLIASGRFEEPARAKAKGLSEQNVAYQGRVIVSILTLIPALIVELKKVKTPLISDVAVPLLSEWLKEVATRGGLLQKGVFLEKRLFKERRYLGAGGVGRFRDVLWAASLAKKSVKDLSEDQIAALAQKYRAQIESEFDKE